LKHSTDKKGGEKKKELEQLREAEGKNGRYTLEQKKNTRCTEAQGGEFDGSAKFQSQKTTAQKTLRDALGMGGE